MFLITLSSGFFYTSPLITSVKCFSCLTMVKIVSLIVLLFCYKASAAGRSQTSGEAGSGFNRAGKKIQCRSLQLMFYSLQCLRRLRAKLKNWDLPVSQPCCAEPKVDKKRWEWLFFVYRLVQIQGGEDLKVDKKRKNCFFFVYLTLQNRPARPRK